MFTVHSSPAFTLGVNYPWHHYGADFGCVDGVHRGVSLPAHREFLLREFARIRETGATVVRWFLFGDGRGGFLCENGIPRRPDESLFQDVSAALEIAEQTQLQLCLSLIDYLWLQDHSGKRPAHAHEHVLHFAGGREAFLQHVLIPLFREFRCDPAIFAWEVANEPEWAIREFRPVPEAKLHIAEFRAFAAEVAGAIHEFGAAPATLGSARLLWLKAWAELPLDFYDAHYYPSCEQETNQDLAQQLAVLPRLDKPLCLGELPAQDPSAPQYSLANALTVCREAGLAGAGVWRWSKPESTAADSAIGCVDPILLRAWTAPTLKLGLNA
jgi:hypothetical protein